jgi:hypothetical protein
MGRSCRTHGKDKKCVQAEHFEDISVSGRIVLQLTLGK